MATYVVRDGSRSIVVRHLDESCAELVREATAAGRPPLSYRARNTRMGGHGDVATRCPECFYDGLPLALDLPGWIEASARPRDADLNYVYEIASERLCAVQVGKANDVAARLRAHWRGTVSGRLRGIWWLYDELVADPDFVPQLRIEAHPREAARAAESHLRDLRRAQGWQVSSDV